jgi:hypothetical protein
MVKPSIRESLERLRNEAVKRAREGVDQKKKLYEENIVVNEKALVEKVRANITKELAKDTTQRISRKIVDEYLSAFEALIVNLQTSIQEINSFPKAQRTPNGKIFMYPENCRFSYEANSYGPGNRNFGLVVIEQPPQVRTLLIGHGRHHIPLPYVVFVINYYAIGGGYRYSGLNLGFGKQPLKSLDDAMYLPHLPNCDSHSVCLGEYSPGQFDSPAEVASDVVSHLWQSVFAYSFPPFYLGSKSINDWPEWEATSKGNPLDILNGKFREGSPIRELIYYVDQTLEAKSEINRIRSVASQMWNRIANEFRAGEADKLIQEISEEILNEALKLTLQPQKSE